MDKQVLEFLSELKVNNNREWFSANKKKYEAARQQFKTFVDNLIPAFSEIDKRFSGLSADDTIFRIYRDVRFSKDKSPYKTNFGAYIAAGGRKAMNPGLYLQVEPENSFIAGGSYQPDADKLRKIRSEIYYHISEFKDIVDSKSFKMTFGDVTGDRLSRPPAGFPADFKEINLLKFKDHRHEIEVD